MDAVEAHEQALQEERERTAAAADAVTAEYGADGLEPAGVGDDDQGTALAQDQGPGLQPAFTEAELNVIREQVEAGDARFAGVTAQVAAFLRDGGDPGQALALAKAVASLLAASPLHDELLSHFNKLFKTHARARDFCAFHGACGHATPACKRGGAVQDAILWPWHALAKGRQLNTREQSRGNDTPRAPRQFGMPPQHARAHARFHAPMPAYADAPALVPAPAPAPAPRIDPGVMLALKMATELCTGVINGHMHGDRVKVPTLEEALDDRGRDRSRSRGAGRGRGRSPSSSRSRSRGRSSRRARSHSRGRSSRRTHSHSRGRSSRRGRDRSRSRDQGRHHGRSRCSGADKPKRERRSRSRSRGPACSVPSEAFSA